MLDEIVAYVATDPLPEPLTYLVPEELVAQLKIGYSVKIPLGNRTADGFVVGIKKKSEIPSSAYTLKAIKSVNRSYALFSEEQLEWYKWIATYYSSSLASILETAIPAAVADPKEEFIIGIAGPESELNLRGPKAKEIFAYIKELNLPYSLKLVKNKFSNSSATIKNLINLGLITSEYTYPEILPSDNKRNTLAAQKVVLTEEQKNAVEQISACITNSKFEPFLLHGVTGSGKTEVYLNAAEQALAQGLAVLILVPEISLTPQLIERFEARLSQPISILHSAVNKKERWQSWKHLAAGKTRVCLGARSAIFAPISKLGLILVDEEHDSSYKQSEGIRYHGRDIAVMRAKFSDCPIVLGSATPSLETWANAKNRRYTYLSLPYRPLSRNKASIEIVDLSKISWSKMASKTISPKLFEALKENLEKGEQSFLLYNRRGFASYLQCQLCSEAAYCPNCSVTLTLHSSQNSLVCHYCGLSQVTPKFCSKCSPANPNESDQSKVPLMIERGAGTEKAVDEIKELFAEAKVERLDRDSVSSTQDLEAILEKVRNNECHILVGTQMIAKGHDIPNVTLVGVLDSDLGLHMPDFRASERIFNLLTQVAGRAGRGSLQGQVILQTRVPKHPVIQFALKDDYLGFAETELKKRGELSYPPYGKLLRIVISAAELSNSKQASEALATICLRFCEADDQLTCLGPAPCPFERLRGLFRFHILLKHKSSATLTQITKNLKAVVTKLQKGVHKETRITFDLDPHDML
jgi:primosomal protein N' (replication factor Y)